MSVEFLERRDHLLGVTVNLDSGENLADDAGGIDDERGALDPHELSSVERLLFEDSVSFANLVADINQQREVEIKRLGKLLVGCCAVTRDANEVSAQFAHRR